MPTAATRCIDSIPTVSARTAIGAMTGLDGGLLDLAVDKNDRLVGITRTKLYSLSSTTGAATLIRDLSTSAPDLHEPVVRPGAAMSRSRTS